MPMLTNSEVLLRAILSVTARQSFPPELLAEVVLKGSGAKQLRAFNMCDGTMSQTEISKASKLDPASFSRTVARWVEAGILFRLGTGRNTKLLHVYALPPQTNKDKKER
jgi:hypothetical protein